MLPVADEVLLLIGESFLPLQIGFFYFALIPSALRLSECLCLDPHCTWVVLKCPVLTFDQLHMHNIPTLHVFTVVGIEPRALHKLDRCSTAESDLATQSC